MYCSQCCVNLFFAKTMKLHLALFYMVHLGVSFLRQSLMLQAGELWVCCVAEDVPEVILLPLSPECWAYRSALPSVATVLCFLSKILFSAITMHVYLCVGMCACECKWLGARRRCWSPWTRCFRQCWNTVRGHWEPSTGPLQEHRAFLTAVSSLLPHMLRILTSKLLPKPLGQSCKKWSLLFSNLALKKSMYSNQQTELKRWFPRSQISNHL